MRSLYEGWVAIVNICVEYAEFRLWERNWKLSMEVNEKIRRAYPKHSVRYDQGTWTVDYVEPGCICAGTIASPECGCGVEVLPPGGRECQLFPTKEQLFDFVDECVTHGRRDGVAKACTILDLQQEMIARGDSLEAITSIFH